MDQVKPITRVPEASTSGEIASFEEFFQQHQGDLHAALWLITRNRHEAEEIMQDAFLRLWERWDRVATVQDPVGYLYRTAMNEFRSRARRAAMALRRAVHTLPVDDAMAAVEAREEVALALSKLTPRERAAVVLTNVLGFTSEEASRALGVQPATVRVLAARGRGRIQKEVIDDAQ